MKQGGVTWITAHLDLFDMTACILFWEDFVSSQSQGIVNVVHWDMIATHSFFSGDIWCVHNMVPKAFSATLCYSAGQRDTQLLKFSSSYF